MKILMIIAVLLVGSCGFSPVYKATESGSVSNLAMVEIQAPNNLKGQFFKTRLSDLLNPESIVSEYKYKLDVQLSDTQVPLAIQQDRTITRYKIIVIAVYMLKDLDGKIIDEGFVKREGGYDKVDSDYATYVSEEDTTKRIIKELAEDTRIRIVSAILDM